MRQQERIFIHRIGGDGPDPATPGREIFPFWSFTKTAMAICALRLAQEGRIDLDRPLDGWDVTMRQLLDHSSGLPDYTTLPAYAEAVARDDPPWPAERLRTETMAQGRRFAPGTGWAYSNLGSLLARETLEATTGRPLSDLIRETVCRPLGLGSVRLATRRRDFAEVVWPGARRYHPGWVYHGCLVGTAADAARLLHGLFAGRLLDAGTLARMQVARTLGGALPGRPWTEHGYATGLMRGRCGDVGRAVGHSGGGPFCVNAVYHFPDLPVPTTVACFAGGTEEGVAERAAVDAARKARPGRSRRIAH